ncbi:MAG: PEP-CTERM sorting domain-containing protein [Rhodospirillaceae bacterium]|nr:PEP-CTERM sorting domain-containing protein [Rhodospirillaceae bacterium]
MLGDDNDYDDLVVTFRRDIVPEPGALGLFGIALLGFAGLMRRRFFGRLRRGQSGESTRCQPFGPRHSSGWKRAL